VPGDGCHRFDENGSEGFGAGRLHKQFDVVHHRSQDAHVHLPSRVRIVSHLRFLIPSPDTDQTPSGNNIAHLNTPPNYKSTWGFNDGAQNDIFVAATKPAPTTYIVNPYATPTGTTVAGGTPTATALPSGWVSYGCSTDQDSPRVLNGPSVASDNNTISGCTSSCAYQGYTWAGVEYGRGMSCHPSCRAPFSPPKRDAGSWLMRHRVLVWFFGLDQPHQQLQLQRPMLSGDPWAKCGGSYAIEVFFGPSTVPEVAGADTLPTGWSNLGCFTDQDSPRTLDSDFVTSSNNTYSQCIAHCSSANYTYAGVEYGDGECMNGCDMRSGREQSLIIGNRVLV
jgi:hypothetical protein